MGEKQPERIVKEAAREALADENELLKSSGQPEGLSFDWTYDVDSYNYPAFEDDPEGDKEIYGRNFNDSDEFEEFLGYSPIDAIINACKPGLYGGYRYDEYGLGTMGWQTPGKMIEDMENLENAKGPDGYGLVNNDGMRWRVWLNGDVIEDGEGFMDKGEVLDFVKEYEADAYGNLPGDEDYNGAGEGQYSRDSLIEKEGRKKIDDKRMIYEAAHQLARREVLGEDFDAKASHRMAGIEEIEDDTLAIKTGLMRATSNLRWLVHDVDVELLGKGDIIEQVGRIIEELEDVKSRATNMLGGNLL